MLSSDILDYSNHFKRLADAFGLENLNIRNYNSQKILTRDIRIDFCDAIGLNVDKLTFSTDHDNLSLSWESINFLVNLNKLSHSIEQHRKIVSLLIERDKKNSENSHSFLDSVRRKKIISRFADSNKEFFDNFSVVGGAFNYSSEVIDDHSVPEFDLDNFLNVLRDISPSIFIQFKKNKPFTIESKILFLHLPKTGGISLYNAIKESVGAYKSLRFIDGSHENREHYLSMTELEMSQTSLISGHFPLPFFQKKISSDYKIITIVREPIDRELSAYYYMKGWSGHPRHKFISNLSLDDYVTLLEKDVTAQNLQCLLISGTPEFDSAVASIEKNKVLIIPYEKLNQSKKKIETYLSINLQDIEVLNKTKFRLAKDEISPDLLERLRKITMNDEKLYRYALRTYGEL
jgi:hypothetical protein